MPENAFDVLKSRGLVQNCTDESEVRELFDQGPVVAYVGYDPTAGSLHVGHLFTLMAVMHLERCGHHPIVLLGGGTAMVGDPSGKTELRQMLSRSEIAANTTRIASQVGNIFGGLGAHSVVIDNSEWLLELNYIDFLRDIGSQFSVNRMLTAESYKQRLERGLSFIEFNYQLLQAYDFLQIHKRYGCRLQMGGDDQWGNILAGVDLVRRLSRERVHGLTFPLQVTAAGEKMGKTSNGAVWLDRERMSPYDYYQHWVNTNDRDVKRMLGFFTFLPMEEIAIVENLDGALVNAAKSILAFEATAIAHGQEEAKAAHAAALGAFGGREIPVDLLKTSSIPRTGLGSSADVPTTTLAIDNSTDGIPLIQIMVDVGLAKSKKDARRLIEQGAVKLGDETITDSTKKLQQTDLSAKGVLLRCGKKRLHRIKC